MIELTGRRLGLDAETAHDYEAFHDGAALIDLSDRGRMRFSGAGARNALNGVLTCDIAPLAAGEGTYGVALTSKGKVVADAAVFASADSFLVECSASAWPGWQQLVSKYINPRLAARKDESATMGAIGVFGPEAARIVAAITGSDKAALEALTMYSHVDVIFTAGSVSIGRIPDMGVEGFRMMTARAAVDALRSAAIAEGARAIGVRAAECARIEAGRPVWGIDMDESTLPQEANLEAIGAISYTKGCYTGQEVVARLHFRGHVNRRLMGLRIEGTAMPGRGTELTNSEGAECGDVRSSILSPRFGVIALAMVRREVDAGSQVIVQIDGAEARAEVTPLPFG
jgi:tRNA-modifying protein YgfZ